MKTKKERSKKIEVKTEIVNCPKCGLNEYLYADCTETLIPLCCAGAILGISGDAVRLKKAGTEDLYVIPLSNSIRPPIRVILEQVIALKKSRIEIVRNHAANFRKALQTVRN